MRGKLETNGPAGKPARKLEAGQAGNFLAGHASWKAGKIFLKKYPILV